MEPTVGTRFMANMKNTSELVFSPGITHLHNTAKERKENEIGLHLYDDKNLYSPQPVAMKLKSEGKRHFPLHFGSSGLRPSTLQTFATTAATNTNQNTS